MFSHNVSNLESIPNHLFWRSGSDDFKVAVSSWDFLLTARQRAETFEGQMIPLIIGLKLIEIQ